MTAQQIYFASVTELQRVKIGCSVNPSARLVSIGEWVPFPLVLRATIERMQRELAA